MKRYAVRAAVFFVTVAYFLFLTHDGLNDYFNVDDTTNLYVPWLHSIGSLIKGTVFFWSGAVRPIGSLIYRVVYAGWGWHPYPFRVACCAILILNLGLAYWLYLLLFVEERIAALALVAGCFHGSFWTIYASTGTVYDMASQTFFLFGVAYYVRARRLRSTPSAADTLCLSIATVGAFQAKEMGFALPLVVAAYEVLFHWLECYLQWRKWPLRVLAPMAAVVGAGVAGLFLAKNNVHFMLGAYTPSFTLGRYLETTKMHVDLLFFKSLPVSPIAAAAFLLLLLAVALGFRSRLMLFGWLYFNLGLLPLSFEPPRDDGYVLFVPYTGLAIYFAALVSECLSKSHAGRTTARDVVAVAFIAVIAVQAWERLMVAARGFGPGGETWVRELTVFVDSKRGAIPANARVAILNDPFDEGGARQPQYIWHLTLNRRDIEIERASCKAEISTCLKRPVGDYASIAEYRDKQYFEKKPGR